MIVKNVMTTVDLPSGMWLDCWLFLKQVPQSDAGAGVHMLVHSSSFILTLCEPFVCRWVERRLPLSWQRGTCQRWSLQSHHSAALQIKRISYKRAAHTPSWLRTHFRRSPCVYDSWCSPASVTTGSDRKVSVNRGELVLKPFLSSSNSWVNARMLSLQSECKVHFDITEVIMTEVIN